MLVKPFVTEEEFVEFIADKGIMDKMVKKAVFLAKHVHGEARRDDGREYLYQHIFPIAIDAYKRIKTKKAVILALLHDVLEDSDEPSIHEEVKALGANLYEDLKLLIKPKQYIKGQPRTVEIKHKEHRLFVEQLSKADFEVKMIKGLDRLNNILCTEGVKSPDKYTRFLRDT